ncbi:DUF294 nucleotidyltransferase-like domain-containing protein [Roseomonas sp. OT10]|uniref:DUF294 nucleotidyltransferase-like domain-containing protein n=1 Tax=Roseomonas cutis TaxID=2897332 RepID=UPI001E3875CE|nr:DUF294 nucleotidyltransferase-like domain-containing protein [Roseomonas sp. OT10]UFN48624.1 DUF294 nucleotidyltransferase-like domain-containing protein [Roseomonas sp. OT10]
MSEGFHSGNPPFDRLTHAEVERLRDALDIAYFRPGERIVTRGQTSDHLHVVLKGRVEVRDAAGELQAMLGPHDSFDARALVHGAAGEDFVAGEETLCHLLPGALVRALISANAGFAAFFYAEISRKLDALAMQGGVHGVDSVLHARVDEARRGRAVFIGAEASIEAAGTLMGEADTNALFVRDGERVGVVTGMNLAKALILRRLPLGTPIREIAHFDLLAVEAEDFVSDALLLMYKHGKRRLAVRRSGEFTGFLEDIDLLGLFAGNAQLLPSRIDSARGLDDLAGVAADIQAQVERLHRQGLRVEAIAEVTSDLNRRLLARVHDMVAPAGIRTMGCLFLMGSEARGEQTLRTDQDNGLLLAGPVPEAELAAYRADFTGALDRLGFPPCPGEVMVRNPIWSRPLHEFLRQIEGWVRGGEPEAAMHLAIFADAEAVAGPAALLQEARGHLAGLMRGEPVLLARFAHLIETFAAPGAGLLGSLMASVGIGGPDSIDIKRAGLFPIVHGLRVMALERGIPASSTAGRLKAVVESGGLSGEFGRELLAALRVLMEFRLRAQLEARRRNDPKEGGGSVVRLDRLSAVDRDILRDALRLARELRGLVQDRYQLQAF